MRVLLVGLGGFVGSILRYWLSGVAQELTPRSSFPIGTFVVNVFGCLTIGVLAELAETRGFLTADVRALLIVGVLGGFTTFSAFANESVSAWRDGSVTTAALNVVLSVAACLFAVWAGRVLANYVWR
jgi:CrcB protein